MMRLFFRFLGFVERVGNRLPHPFTLFFLMALLVPVMSWILSLAGTGVTHPVSGAKVEVVNLFQAEQLKRMLTEAVSNFTGFAPLGTVLVAMIGIGVAERSGLFAAGLRLLVAGVGRRWITPALVFAGIMSSLAADSGFIILPPLGALVFLGLGRHPLAGMFAVLAGVSGGFSANLFITVLDPLLSGLTESAAQLYDPTYRVNALANYYFMVASTVMLTGLGWLVSEKLVEPRLGTWQRPEGFAEEALASGKSGGPETAERRALLAAAACFLVLLAGALLLVLPEGALLRDEDGEPWPFFDALVPIFAVLLFVPGLVFGVMTGSIRSDHDVARMTGDTLATMGTYIALAFMAAQFIEYFNWSNLGFVLAISGADLLRGLQLTGIPLLIGIILISGTINLFIGSASAKWAILGTVLVPMMMNLGYSPELSQALFRVGDSVTNMITPLSTYFPIILAFASKYVPGIRLGTVIAAMLPYSIVFFFCWSVLLFGWYLLGLPLGPGAPLTYGS
ncbi:MAG: AbgT family transporter [Puniceicoccaceae bacterium]|nr:MAG: AbgT family transporter [Puniceicoccaceae bacterium]